MEKVGILHPGMMGIYVAASAVNSGYELFWASEGRSEATKQRAKLQRLQDLVQLESLCRKCQVLISVCPPHAALDMAKKVAALSFKGLYLDANAISPGTVRDIETLFKNSDIVFVDGGIIGRPEWEKTGTRLYLSGEKAELLRPLFAGGILTASVVGNEIGQASGLKMCYAAYTKGTTALLASILALAEKLDVRDTLEARWDQNWPGFETASHKRICQSASKAWRFEGEMKEISKAFDETGLPRGFHAAAQEIFGYLREYKNAQTLPDFEAVLQSLIEQS